MAFQTTASIIPAPARRQGHGEIPASRKSLTCPYCSPQPIDLSRPIGTTRKFAYGSGKIVAWVESSCKYNWNHLRRPCAVGSGLRHAAAYTVPAQDSN